MKIFNRNTPPFTALFAAIALAAPIHLASVHAIENPDFTKGDSIPDNAKKDWNLGPTGARGWMYFENMGTFKARQIAITKVAGGSPADGILEEGDVILGVFNEPFSHDPRLELGRAITRAEATDGELPLTVWRDGQTGQLTLNLPVLGSYSPTAPYDCPKSALILERGSEALAERMQEDGYPRSVNAITRSLNAMGLLASGNREFLPLIKREAEWAADFETQQFETWWYGYVITMLAEYIIATGDETKLPALRRMAVKASEGQSIVGTWSHGYAAPDGRAAAYGMLNSPGVVLTIGLVLAREAGVDDDVVEEAIKRSDRMLRFYIGKGGVPYGDHDPQLATHNTNGKNGMAAVLYDLLEDKEGTEFFSRMSTASHGNERDLGHTGNFFNITWAMPSIARSGPHATGAWMAEYGDWYFDLARRWDGTFPHQGPPQARNDRYGDWDATGAYLIAYGMPLKTTRITGRNSIAEPLDVETAQQIINAGRGWTNSDKNSAYDALSEEDLFGLLGSWSPVVRERAAMAIARRDGDPPVSTLVRMLDSESLYARHGACQALAQLKGKAASAVPALQKTLEADDLWLRVKAAEALSEIGGPAMAALPQMLKMVIAGPSEEDPRGMEQRYVATALFTGMLRRGSLDDVDQDLLREAIAAGLRNEDGHTRGSIGRIFSRLSYEQIEPLLPAILEAVAEPAPSGVMFANVVRLQGLKILAKHRISEGLDYSLSFLDIDSWGKRQRLDGVIEAIGLYGGAAKPLLPELRQLEKDLHDHREARGLKPQIERLQALIKDIENADEIPELRSLN